LNVLDPGEFEVWVEYSAREDQIGANLDLSVGSENLNWTLSEAFYPELIASPDRIARKEAPEQTWKLKSLGKLTLKSGLQVLKMKAKHIPESGLGDIYSIRLRPVRRDN
jgi:arylsulfatase A